MNKHIEICDKCGKVVEFPSELKVIGVCYRHDVEHDWTLQLCAVCRQEFDKVKEVFTEAKRKLEDYDSKQLAKHILGKEEDGSGKKPEADETVDAGL